MPGKEVVAIQLEQAKNRLESQLRDTFREYGRSKMGPVEFRLNLEERVKAEDDEAGEDERALRNRVRNLVDTFHGEEVVTRTGVRVYNLTVIDSNADGEPAVNVKYEYAVDTGMGAEQMSPLTSAHMPPSSAHDNETEADRP